MIDNLFHNLITSDDSAITMKQINISLARVIITYKRWNHG